MKPTPKKPAKPSPPKAPEHFEPFEEDYSMDAEEEHESMSQEACDDFDVEERKAAPSSTSSTKEKGK